MKLPRVQISVRWLLFAVAAFAVSTWTAMMLQRAFHYREQAENQAWLEAKHRSEEHRLRTSEDRSFGAEAIPGEIRREAEEADRHGRLKRQYQQLATHPWEDAPHDLPLPYPWDRDRDRAVLEAALADLMDPKNPENAIEFWTAGGAPCPEIVVGETTYSWSSDSDGDESDDAWDDLNRRNSGGPILIAGIGVGGSLKVSYDDPDRLFQESVDADMAFRDYFHKLHPTSCGYAWVTLPGFSRDGRKAFLFISGGYGGGHSVSWTYELARADSGWEVRERGCHVSQ